jgi:hypothetical protein
MKKNLIKKEEDKVLIQKTKNFLIKQPVAHSDNIIRNFSKKMGKYKDKRDLPQHYIDDWTKAVTAIGLDTHFPVSETVPEKYQDMLIQVIRDTEAQYNCKSTFEKMLAETIACMYVKSIFFSEKLNNLVSSEKDPSNEKTRFYESIGKEIERTNRIMNNSILTMTQLKSSSLPFKVNAKTTFIAQNQQFNNFNNKENQ